MTEETAATVVIDTGSYTTKVGLAMEDTPRLSVRTLCAVPRGTFSALTYFGRECLDRTETHNIVCPADNGTIVEWDLMEQFWSAQIAELQVEHSQTSVLTSHHAFTPKLTRERTAQIFFEQFNVPCFFSLSAPLLVVYASGRVGGLVLDAGHCATSAVPVIDGIAHYWAQTFDPNGGRRIDEHLARTFTEGRASTLVKERDVRVPANYAKEASELTALPDGKSLEVLRAALRLGESLFDARAIGACGLGADELVAAAIEKAEPETRRELAAGVLPSGGNALFPGFNDRLQRELEVALPESYKVKVIPTQDRQNMVWCGGAVVASLSTFNPMWLSRAEYDEFGPSLISRKAM